MELRKFDNIFFSPHFDDVVFSCGGLISRLKGMKSVLVVTLFSGIGEGVPSKIGKDYFLDCGYKDMKSLFNLRKQEEKKAAEMLGYRVCSMGYPDAVFRFKKHVAGREFFYSNRSQLFGDINKNDIVAKEIEEKVNLLVKKYSKEKTKIYFPMGLGGHVDHKMVRYLGNNLVTARKKYFFEDFPYVTDDGGGDSNNMKLTEIPTPKRILEKKFGAMVVYKSQIKGLFKSNDDLKKRLVDFYMEKGEHYWQSEVKISILLATMNRPNLVGNCLRSILKNSGNNWEVLVLDQSNNQDTKKVVEGFKSRKIRYKSLDRPGRARAINEGIKLSQGEILAFTDDDVIVSDNWLKLIEGEFENKKVDIVFGKTVPYQRTRKEGLGCASVSPIEWNRKEMIAMDNLFCKEYFGLGSNMAVRKINFKKYGNFVEWLGVGAIAGGGEDWEYTYWLVKNGGKVLLDPGIVVYHDRWLPELQLIRLLARYAMGTSSFLIYLTLVMGDKRFGRNWQYWTKVYFSNVWKSRNSLGLRWAGIMMSLTINWLVGFWLGVTMSVLGSKKRVTYPRY